MNNEKDKDVFVLNNQKITQDKKREKRPAAQHSPREKVPGSSYNIESEDIKI